MDVQIRPVSIDIDVEQLSAWPHVHSTPITAGEDTILGERPGGGQQQRGRNKRSVCHVVLFIGGVFMPSHFLGMTYGVLGFVHWFRRSVGSPWRYLLLVLNIILAHAGWEGLAALSSVMSPIM